MNKHNLPLSMSMRELMPIVAEMLNDGQTVSLTVKGVSMQPFLMDGRDEIFMVSPKGRKPRVGDLYMFRRADGSYAMHRICRVHADGTLDFIGDGQRLVEKGITPDALEAYVPKVRRKEKIINCEKGVAHRLLTARMKFRLRHPRFIRFASVIKRAVLRPFYFIRKQRG